MEANDFLNIAPEIGKKDYKFIRWYNQSLVVKDKKKTKNETKTNEVIYDKDDEKVSIKKYTLSLPITDEQFGEF